MKRPYDVISAVVPPNKQTEQLPESPRAVSAGGSGPVGVTSQTFPAALPVLGFGLPVVPPPPQGPLHCPSTVAVPRRERARPPCGAVGSAVPGRVALSLQLTPRPFD